MMQGDRETRGTGEKKSEDSKCSVAADQEAERKMKRGEEDSGGPAMRARGSKRRREEDGLSPGSWAADLETETRRRKEKEDGKSDPESKGTNEEKEHGESFESRMADLGEDSSPPAQDSTDSSCPDIKLVLGRQGEGGREVTVSREALAGLSPVFKSMLTHDMAEKNQGTVRLGAVSPKAWTVISAFYFSHKKLVTMDNVEEMVSMADMYELTDLKNHCDDYLCKNAHKYESFSDLLNWATTFRLKKLTTNLLKLVLEDFECFVQTDSFLRLSKEVLLEILGGPYIVSSEDTVCCAVLRWLQDQNADHDTVEKVLQQLNLNEVCLSCLEKHLSESQYAALRDVVLCFMEKEKQVRKKNTQQQLSVQWFAHKAYGRRYLHLPDKSDRLFGPTCRCKSGDVGDLIYFGYKGPHRHLGVVLDGTLSKQTEMKYGLEKTGAPFSAACFFKNFLAVKIAPVSVAFLDLETKRSSQICWLLQPRKKEGMVLMGDALYFVMGEWSNVSLDCIEVIRSITSIGHPAGRMLIATTNVAATAVGNLIIASGSCGKEKIYQSFNTETGVAVILRRDQYGFRRQNPCSLGFRGALFGQASSFVCILLQENGEVAITEERYPETSTAFSASEFHGPDIQCRAEGEDCVPQKLQQLVHRYPENTVYSVRFSPGDKRANIVPLPLSMDGYIMFTIRK